MKLQNYVMNSWVAGSGADASPWFRIFNPVTQGEKFDASRIRFNPGGLAVVFRG